MFSLSVPQRVEDVCVQVMRGIITLVLTYLAVSPRLGHHLHPLFVLTVWKLSPSVRLDMKTGKWRSDIGNEYCKYLGSRSDNTNQWAPVSGRVLPYWLLFRVGIQMKWSIWITSPQTRFTSNRYYSRRSCIKYSKVKFFSIDFFQKNENLMEKFPVDEFCL